MQSRENSQKPQLGPFFDDFEVKYLQIANFSEKQVSFMLKVIFSANFRPKTKKIVRTVFEKNIKVPHFRKCLQIKNFFQKSGSFTFLPLQSPNFMQKIRKSFLKKLGYQPTNYYQQHRSYMTSLTLVQLNFCIQFVLFERHIKSYYFRRVCSILSLNN